MTGRSVYDLVLEKKLLTREQLDEILQPEVLTQPRAFRVKEPPGEVPRADQAPKPDRLSQID